MDWISELWRWEVVGTLITVFIGIGLSVMSMSPPEFILAKVCFSLAAILLLVRTGTWLFPFITSASFIARTGLSILVFGSIIALWIESMRWVAAREPPYVKITNGIEWEFGGNFLGGGIYGELGIRIGTFQVYGIKPNWAHIKECERPCRVPSDRRKV